MTLKGKNSFYKKQLKAWAVRSTCHRTRTAAIIVSERGPIAHGYNGNPKGVPHCDKLGCIREDMKIPSGQRHELCTGSHAEINAITQCARGSFIDDTSVMYTLYHPCAYCMKAIINAGIKTVYYVEDYNDELSKKLAVLSKIQVVKI